MESSNEVVKSAHKMQVVGPGDKLLVMLSGGPDSVCLAHLLVHAVANAGVSALHVNYGLREEADDDERFCRELCEALGIELFTQQVSLSGKRNMQADARECRYRLAESVRQRERLDLIATGHTLSDQAETVIYRLAASPGRRALLGMRAREGRVVRPLLGVTREEVLGYLTDLGLQWREDVTNRDLTYARSRIRERVIPELKRINSAAEQNIAATRDALSDEAEVLDKLVSDAVDTLGVKGCNPSLDGKRLVQLPKALQRLVIRKMAESVAGDEFPLSASRADEIIGLCDREGSVGIDLGPVRVVSEYGILRFYVAQSEIPPLEELSLPVPGVCVFGEWEVKCDVLDSPPPMSSVDSTKDRDQALLDADCLGDEVTVRPWAEGDRLRPLGMEGTKSLQDLFTDEKVPRSLRTRLPVVESDGAVAWVAGVAVSDDFKVTQKTGRAVRIKARLID